MAFRPRIRQKGLQIRMQVDAAIDARSQRVKAQRHRVHRRGKTHAIAQTEPHQDIVLIYEPVFEVIDGIPVGIVIERNRDGGESAPSGVKIAQCVIPDSR